MQYIYLHVHIHGVAHFLSVYTYIQYKDQFANAGSEIIII